MTATTGPATITSGQPASLTVAEQRQLIEALTRAGEPIPDPQGLEQALIRYARREFGARLRPRTVDPLWGLAPSARDPATEFQAARAAGELPSWLADIERKDDRYRALKSAALHYRAAVALPFETLAPPGTMREGADDPTVVALRTRLAGEGAALAPAAAPSVFDADLKTALTAFQEKSGLVADGVLGPRTLAVLNTTPAERLVQIEVNLERLRWLPRVLPADRLEVNIAAADATLYRRNRPVLTMRIVVGDLSHKTPMFASRIETVVLNPPWNVPASIARNEILPRAARDPGYLARNHFAYVGGRLQQRPGPNNSLGRIKFDLPSPYGVYLHDTPGRAAFARPVRTLSHGCMRLEKPRELAAELLEAQGWTAASIASAIDAGSTRHIALTRPMPLFVIYQTAIVEPSGRIRFAPDHYGWDAKLAAALAGSSPRTTEPAPAPVCAG